MKNLQLIILFAISSLFLAATQPVQYEAAMEKAIEQLYQAQTAEALQAAANTFDRIAQKETDKWRPRYYAGYAQLMSATRSDDLSKVDKLLDVALDHIKAAKELSPGNSELLTLEGFIHMMRIPVDPASRGPQYSGMAMGALQQAVAMDPDNPRARLILSDMQYGTAQFFGSDTSEACATLKKAIELFETSTPAHKLDPAWGKEWAMNSQKQKGC